MSGAEKDARDELLNELSASLSLLRYVAAGLEGLGLDESALAHALELAITVGEGEKDRLSAAPILTPLSRGPDTRR